MKYLSFVLPVRTFVALGSALARGNVRFEESGMEGDLLATELVGADLSTTARAVDHDWFQGREGLSDLRVYLAITEARLEALPEHDSN